MTIMSRNAGLALATVLLAATPASAGDYAAYGGGIKDGRGGVPVPAPMPVYETFRWYVRADLGIGWQTTPSISERGMQYGRTDSAAPFGMDSSWFNNDFNTFFTGGGGIGLYISPRWRGDITVDTRSKDTVSVAGNYSYAEVQTVAPHLATGNTIRGSTVEHTNVRATVALANLYYDLTDRGAFTPYVGLGVGFAVRYVDRQHGTQEARYLPTDLPDGYTRSFSGHMKTSEVVPAVAATVGASYALSPGVLVDFNYRYTWLGNTDNTININGTPSKLSLGDSQDHTLRAGLRWNVW